MYFRIIVMVIALLISATSGYGKNEKVLLLPIDMSGVGKFAYLKGALDGMIASRLSNVKNVELVDAALSEKQLALMSGQGEQVSGTNVFKQLQVDYIAKGVCYDTVKGLTLQLSFFRDVEKKAPVTVVMTVAKEDELFTEMEHFVQKINTAVFKNGRDDGGASFDVSGLRAFQTEHPEKAYKEGRYDRSPSAEQSGGHLVSSKMKSSINIDHALVAMDRADLDGDGVEEFVFISSQNLVIARQHENRLRIVYETSLGKRYKAHRMNLADLDQDGRSEIYISGNKTFYPSSAVYTWSQESGLKPLKTNLRWYLRPLRDQDGQMILLGQRATREIKRDFLSPKIYKLEWSGKTNEIVGEEPFSLPEKINLFDFVMADLDGDNVTEIVAVDKNEKLLVYGSDSKLLWVSDEDYGGSRTFFGPSRFQVQNVKSFETGGMDKVSLADRKYVFIPGRILVADTDGDGKDEIIVGQNQFQGTRILPNLRSYSGGTVACLKWHDGAMDKLWQTRYIPGYIADYSFFFADPSTSVNNGLENAFLVTGHAIGKGLFGLSSGDSTKIEIQEIGLEQGQK